MPSNTRLIKTKLTTRQKITIAMLLSFSILAGMSTACFARDKDEQVPKITEQELKKNFLLYESLCQKTKIYIGTKWFYNKPLSAEQERILKEIDAFFASKEKQELLDTAEKKNSNQFSPEEKEVWQEFLKNLEAIQKLN